MYFLRTRTRPTETTTHTMLIYHGTPIVRSYYGIISPVPALSREALVDPA